MAKKRKGRARKRVAGKDLTLDNVKRARGGVDVKGGRKAGKDQQDFMIVKMSDIIITGVAPGGSGGAGLTQ